MEKPKINCFHCIHFFITWDKENPNGCKAMKFKTRKMPSVLVYDSSGMDCKQFSPKKKNPGV